MIDCTGLGKTKTKQPTKKPIFPTNLFSLLSILLKFSQAVTLPQHKYCSSHFSEDLCSPQKLIMTQSFKNKITEIKGWLLLGWFSTVFFPLQNIDFMKEIFLKDCCISGCISALLNGKYIILKGLFIKICLTSWNLFPTWIFVLC